MRFFWASPPDGQFFPFIEIATVADATGGIATITTYIDYLIGDDVYCRAEYYNGTIINDEKHKGEMTWKV